MQALPAAVLGSRCALEVALAGGVAVGAAAVVRVVQALLLVLGVHPEQARDLDQPEEQAHVDDGPACRQGQRHMSAAAMHAHRQGSMDAKCLPSLVCMHAGDAQMRNSYEQAQPRRRTSDPDDLDELRAQQVAVATGHEAAVVQAVLAVVSAQAVRALQSRALHSADGAI